MINGPVNVPPINGKYVFPGTLPRNCDIVALRVVAVPGMFAVPP
jgi:hypothetical protein